MKALKTKVILSGIVLMFAFIATIGTTYAWFTVSDTVTVESMTLNVTSADNLLILANNQSVTYDLDGDGGSTDLLTPSNYQTNITNSDLYAAGYLYESISGSPGSWTLTDPWRLNPVTAVASDYNSIDGSSLNSLNATDGTIGSAPSNLNSGSYIQLQFYLLSQSEDTQYIEISGLSITNDAGNTTGQDAVIDAVRLAIWSTDDPLGTPSANAASIFGNNADYSYDFTGTIYDDDEATISRVGDTLDEVATDNSGSVTSAAAAAAVLTSASTADLFTLAPNTPTLVTVNIFVEGWDADSTNDIALAAFNISFGFVFGTQD